MGKQYKYIRKVRAIMKATVKGNSIIYIICDVDTIIYSIILKNKRFPTTFASVKEGKKLVDFLNKEYGSDKYSLILLHR